MADRPSRGPRKTGARPPVRTKTGRPTKAAARAAAGAAFRNPVKKPVAQKSPGAPRSAVEKSIAMAAKPLPALPGKAAGVQMIPVREAEEGMRLDRWFKERFPALAFGHLQKLCRTGQIRVDGARAKTAARLSVGMTVRVPPLKAEGDVGEDGVAAPAVRRPNEDDKDAKFLKDITIHEDRDILVLNKPFGLAVQGGSGIARHVDGLLESLRDRQGQKPRLVHRIDKDTAGVLVVAKTRLAASELARAFRSRLTRKIYWALVQGVPRVRQGRISTYLAKGEGEGAEGERMRVAEHGDDGAAHALTYYAVVDQAAQKLAWLSLKPVTGRTHQLRAHAAHIGHPIIGDPKYFDVENWEFPGGLQNRLHLLARRLVVPMPNGDVLDVSAPLPPHMAQSWAVLGFDASDYDPIVDAPE
ncbi:RluA family pseudouridine synthase [Hansschlegelia plantiphila]|uniref:Pseudouridine synthase n=1 Tax=Hansschlegelia plantiphila TaxID=374655 RepID=A0A9W6MWW7_9HYPH|nr:RluA family pseudouridine synthase [Hansschlegelia plantiphila]GLK69448.1 pseudouridine synthase [Hansschlegelia plantiphila]